MTTAIMQPYFLPYIGYFQLINSVDKFVLYDDIKYTKKGWINRNRICNGELVTIPLKKASDYLDVVERKLSDDWVIQKRKLRNKVQSCYSKSMNYEIGMKIFNNILDYESDNLFEFIYNSLKEINSYLDIKTEIIVSSNLKRNRELSPQDSVIEVCKKLDTNLYINSIGGKSLYKKEQFKLEGISLKFLRNMYINNFSIVDIIMNISKDDIKRKILNDYELE